MSTPEAPPPEAPPTAAPAAVERRPVAPCPRCGAAMAPDQEWCLNCGSAARTTIAATPRWRLPLALLAVVAVLCGAALAWAFVELTNNDDDVRAATSTAIAPPATATATAPPATATVPPAAAPAPTTPPAG